MLFLSILGYILLVIGLVLAAIIFVPYNYHVSGEYFGKPQINGSISWLFGGIKINFRQHLKQNMDIVLTILGLNRKIKVRLKSTGAKSKKDTEHSENVKTVGSKKLSNFGQYLKRDVIQKAISVFLKLLKHCQPTTLSIHAKIGFNDPLYTGLLYAFNSQFYLLFNKYDINIQPVFDEEIVEGRFLIGGRIWLPYLILVMIGFLISKPIRNIFISNFKRKIKGGLQYVR
ncbi:MAG: DUF2953 domain-containing protein [Desulfitobacteriaceae bacterium]